MELKRYTTEELKSKLIDIFYDTVSDNESVTNMIVLHYNYLNELKKYKERKEIYEEALAKRKLAGACRDSLTRQLAYLDEGIKNIESSCMETQKHIYALTHSTDYSRSIITIPLDKKINSYYDDLSLEVLFYDDVSTLCGKFEEYRKLESKEDRFKFIVDNTEITHISLVYAPSHITRAVISIQGDLNFGNSRVAESGITLLTDKFSNFQDLTLKDTLEINNNDLRQYFQSKIDLDKENLKKLASVFIRGDKYEIYETPELLGDNIYTLMIRYTCRSTGRVYYNRLNLRNLSISPEFVEGNYDSYCRAWWHLNTLGGNVDGKPVIRC